MVFGHDLGDHTEGMDFIVAEGFGIGHQCL